jgi:hypothetical protein
MTAASTDRVSGRRVIVQVLRGCAFTVLLLTGVWVLSFALDWPDGAVSDSGTLGWSWQPHWALLATLFVIFVAALVAGHRKRIVALVRPTGIVAVAMVTAVGAVIALAFADRPPSVVRTCRTLSQCQSIMSRAYGGARVLAPAAGMLKFGGGEVVAVRGGDMDVSLVDASPPASIFFRVTDNGPLQCEPPSGHPGVTTAGNSYCLRFGRCVALADTTTGGLTYGFNVTGIGPCDASWSSQERDRLASILDSLR